MWACLSRGESWKGEFVNRRKDGVEFIEEASIIPLRDDHGQISHFVAIKEDITERKQMTDEIEQHRHDLEGLVSERTEQLREAMEQARTANQAKAVFLANMSHEIRTPMNAIVGLCHMLAGSDLEQQQRHMLDEIRNASGHLLQIINDILDVSRIEAGKLQLQESDFSLHRLMKSIVAMVRPLAQDKGLLLDVDYLKAPNELFGDTVRLRQSLLNYIGNAIKFTEQGSVRVRVRVQDEHDSVYTLLFEVEDTGVGISKENLDKIFLAFEQADSSNTKRYEGSGLGLAITQRLVELMGGTFGVQSELGKGSRFWFSVPLKQSQKAADSEADGDELSVEQGLRFNARVLLVEDNEINRQVASGLLANVGISVTTATNGQEALEEIEAQPFDLVLMDIQMPVMNGLDATRALRSQEAYRDLPILALTANVFDDDRRLCLTVGMNDFVAKPLELNELYSALRRWLPESTRMIVDANAADAAQSDADEQAPQRRQMIKAIQAIEGVDVDKGLINLSGNIPAYLRLLSQFVRDHGADGQLLRDDIGQEAWEPARQRVHAVKGVSGNLGMGMLQERAQALEAVLKARDGSRLDASLDDFVDLLEQTCQELARGLEETPMDEGPVMADGLSESLQQLSGLLKSDDTRANDLFIQIERELSHFDPALARHLGEAIDSFDYARARELVEGIGQGQKPPTGDESR